MSTETLSKSVAVEDTAAPPAPVSLGSRSPVGGRGKHTAFHRNSYSELPGSPVTASTTPAEIEFPKASSAYALFFYSLCFLASRTEHGADIVPLSVPEMASTVKHSRRWVYKALHYLSHHGFLFLIPTPDYVVGLKAERVVCLRVPPTGFLPVTPYVDKDAKELSSTDRAWHGKPSPPQPADPEPALVPSPDVARACQQVVVKATRRVRAAARADLTILDAVPPNDEDAFSRVVTKALAERFGSVRAITVARALLPVPQRIFDPSLRPSLKPAFPGPYNIERAADSPARRSFLRQLDRGFKRLSGRPVDIKWTSAGRTGLSLLFEPLPYYQRARFDVKAFVQATQRYVLVDGATHPDFPGYQVIRGCFHGPPHICRCGVPRPTVSAEPMDRIDPELADDDRAAQPHRFND